MEYKIGLSFTLPVAQAEKVIAFVKSLGSSENSGGYETIGPEGTETPSTESATSSFEPVPRHLERQELRYLLDERLERIVRFIVLKEGRFFNDELAQELGIDDPQTSVYLGHLTRKLRKAGVRAEGFRGANWYSKIRTSGRTLINVRSDVLLVFRNSLVE